VPRKVFVAGEILTAADVNANLMDQAVMVFDDDAARTTAIPSPIEGMVTYLKDTDNLEKFDGSAFVDAAPVVAGIGTNVVQAVKTDTLTTSSTTYTDITGLSVTITPTSTSSKILIFASVSHSATTANVQAFRVLRDATALVVGDTAGVRTSALFAGLADANTAGNEMSGETAVLLDTPNTASAITYKVQGRTGTGGTLAINRYGTDPDDLFRVRAVSTITVIEVAG